MNVPYQVKLVTSLDDPWLASQDYTNFIASTGGIDPLFLGLRGMKILAPIYLHKDMGPFFVAVLQGSLVIALLPLILETKRLLPGVRLKRLHFWGKATECYSKHPCPRLLIGESHTAQEVCAFLAERMQGELSPMWDCWYLSHTYADESGLTGLRKAGLDFHPESSPYKAFEIWNEDLGAEQDLLSWLSGNTRKLVRRGMRNVEQLTPPVHHVQAQSVSDETLQRIADVHSARQHVLAEQGQDRINFFEDPVESAVVREFLHFASSEDALSVHTLQSDEKLMAATFFLGKGAEACHYFYIWTPELQGMEGARLLWYRAVDAELRQKHRHRITHGMGETETKRSFSSRQFPLVCGYVLNPSPASRLRFRMVSLLRAANEAKDKALSRVRVSASRLLRR